MIKKNQIITLIFIVLVILIDQAVKLVVDNYLAIRENLVVIPNFFSITRVYNTGAAWGMFGDSTIVLMIISIVASLVALYASTWNDFKKKKTYSIAICLIVGGAVGNLLDRSFTVAGLYQGVIDMFAFSFGSYDFPVFNVADACLVIGVILLAIDVIFFQEKRRHDKKVSN